MGCSNTLKHLIRAMAHFQCCSGYISPLEVSESLFNSKQLGHESVKLHIWKQYNEVRDVFFFFYLPLTSMT